MKLGIENRNEVIALGVLGAIALVIMGYEFWPSSAAAPGAAQATSASTGARPGVRRSASGKVLPVITPRLDPTLDLALLGQSEEIKYAGNGRNIFVAGSVASIEKPKGNGTDTPTAVYTPPPTPPPPPITLKFFGFANRPGETKKVFLSQNEDVFIAAEGEIVDRRYRVLHILPSCTSCRMRWRWKM